MLKLLKKYLWDPIVNSARPDFCEHIMDRALLEKWPVKKTHEPFILDLPIPNGCEIDPMAKTAYTMHQRTGFQPQYLVGIPNGVAAGGGFVRLPTGEFLTESTRRMAYMLGTKTGFGAKRGNFYRARYRRHKLYLKGDCYYLDMLFSVNYGHWFLDELPRLVSALPHLPPDTKFIVSDPVQEFKLKSLAALGITEERLIPVKGYFETHCERLWFATPLCDGEWASTSPAVFRQIREALLQTYGGTRGPTPEKIFISRRGAASKRLINEDELLPMIEEFGFSVVQTEKLSLAQQVRTFSKVKVVLAAHGAGMTNILFSPPPALLLELQDVKFAPRRWYWKVPSILGHHYSTMTGPVIRSRFQGDTDFTIHPDSLKQYLENSLSQEDGKPKKQWWVSK
jgi:capsular polysaccharide biosynthesis protein